MYTPVTPHPVVPEAQQERSGLARLWYQLGPGSRQRQRLARAEAQRLVALQYRWQEACLHVGLALMIYTPSGVVASVPRIVRADFGDPVTFTVQLRPGQSAADLLTAEKRLSRALGVGGLRFVERGDAWVIVEVTGPQGGAGQGFWDGGPGEGPRLRVA